MTPSARELLELIDRYWDLAYAEGMEGRTHDTEAGDAQQCRHEIESRIATLTQQQGGEQEAGECDTDEEMKDMALASIRALVSPLQHSAICEVFREHAALRSKQAASEGAMQAATNMGYASVMDALDDLADYRNNTTPPRHPADEGASVERAAVALAILECGRGNMNADAFWISLDGRDQVRFRKMAAAALQAGTP